MDFGYTPEQKALEQVAREFVSSVCPPERAKEWDEQGTLPPELFKGFADMEWLGIPFPVEAGGGGGGAIELAILAEELGRASLDVSMCFTGTIINSLCVFEHGTDAHRELLAQEAFDGKIRFAVSMSEPDSGSDVAALRTRAERDGGDFVLNGQKMWCTGAGLPGTQIVMYVRTGEGDKKHDGISAILVDPSSPGVEMHQTPTLARHILGTYELYLSDVRVPVDNLIGPLDGGWKVMLTNLELERAMMSGAYVGVAQATLDEMLAYSKQRTQFGRQIGNFQALAHRMAALQVDIDAARLLARRAAWMVSAGIPCSREAAMAKYKGSETYVAAARLGMQVLAGHGFSTESVMSFRWRESIVATISGGTSEIQLNGIARSMGLRSY
ncbi:acyl-CoA dehydrogenase family protein [Nocardioides sp. WS12]|uniref:acyl-CoA dehydrogenase family protein n=1 Tax=Nocardioides sp. WS12 TaxID=2486272 RepID=UPI0015FE32D3|nr:acyl-CoA dehydrogenase family protein [Nocardioides sp. WS12]